MCLTTPLTPPPSRDLYAPPDEVAQDVLEFSSEVQLDSGARVRVKVSPGEGASDRGTTETNSGQTGVHACARLNTILCSYYCK